MLVEPQNDAFKFVYRGHKTNENNHLEVAVNVNGLIQKLHTQKKNTKKK